MCRCLIPVSITSGYFLKIMICSAGSSSASLTQEPRAAGSGPRLKTDAIMSTACWHGSGTASVTSCVLMTWNLLHQIERATYIYVWQNTDIICFYLKLTNEQFVPIFSRHETQQMFQPQCTVSFELQIAIKRPCAVCMDEIPATRFSQNTSGICINSPRVFQCLQCMFAPVIHNGTEKPASSSRTAGSKSDPIEGRLLELVRVNSFHLCRERM